MTNNIRIIKPGMRLKTLPPESRAVADFDKDRILRIYLAPPSVFYYGNDEYRAVIDGVTYRFLDVAGVVHIYKPENREEKKA